jgi:ribosomal protein S16
MVIKYKRKIKKTSINHICLRLQRKGLPFYPVFRLIVVHKKSRAKKGKILDEIGIFNPSYIYRCYYFDSNKMHYWMERGLIVNYKIKKFIMKFLVEKKKI